MVNSHHARERFRQGQARFAFRALDGTSTQLKCTVDFVIVVVAVTFHHQPTCGGAKSGKSNVRGRRCGHRRLNVGLSHRICQWTSKLRDTIEIRRNDNRGLICCILDAIKNRLWSTRCDALGMHRMRLSDGLRPRDATAAAGLRKPLGRRGDLMPPWRDVKALRVEREADVFAQHPDESPQSRRGSDKHFRDGVEDLLEQGCGVRNVK
mmetsp:Transcript_5229/g.11970  ORF Transcript_5229/g.11970 Transcript_5229/m.11970 type:complete len:208 (-) Transcript_5229:600-1223(-)